MPPDLITGGMAVDNRGHLSYVNDINFAEMRRLYVIANHRPRSVRAWHGHRREAKAVMVVAGAALVAAVKIDDWEHPSPDLPVCSWVLSEEQPAVLTVPAGWANGAMTLTPGTRVMYWSTATLEESQADDYRWPARYWDPWALTDR
jgi:dTDP-4-dehydrorhamnose 3,5-epimerase-like enzyme